MEIREAKETRDFLGQTLNVGDQVVYTHHTPTSSFLVKGMVVGFKRENVNGDIRNRIEVQIATQGTLKRVVMWPDKAIKYVYGKVELNGSDN